MAEQIRHSKSTHTGKQQVRNGAMQYLWPMRTSTNGGRRLPRRCHGGGGRPGEGIRDARGAKADERRPKVSIRAVRGRTLGLDLRAVRRAEGRPRRAKRDVTRLGTLRA